MRKKLFIGALAIAALAAFAGTCTITNIALTPIGTNAVFAGAVQNNSGASILQHNVLVAFLDSGNNVLETKTVQPCLRTLPNGGTDYFSATSSYSSASVATGLARVPFDSTFRVGTAAVGSGTISNLTVTRNTTTLTVAGTFTNTDATTLTAPNACAVVFNSSGSVIVVGLQQTMPDLAQNANSTFTVSMQVPDSTTTVSYVNVYVDGFKGGVPTLPVAQAVSNTPVLATPTPNATPGAAVKLAFLTQPNGGAEGTAFSSQPVVAVQDSLGLTVTGSTAPITLSITAGTGYNGTLTCTANPPVTSGGVATFAGCKIDKAAQFYTLTATSPGLATIVSTQFNISPVGAPVGLGMYVQPGNATGGTAFGTQPQVVLLDAAGGIAWNAAPVAVTMAILNNAGPGTLSGCGANPVTTSSGFAVFSGCSIDKIGTGYTLQFMATSLTAANSAAFNVTVGAAAKLAFTTQPSATAGTGVAFVQQPVVTVQDAGGNTVTGSTAAVTLALNTVSGGPGTFACTVNPQNATTGVDSFAGCKITGAGTYTLTATSPGLTSATSSNIVVS